MSAEPVGSQGNSPSEKSPTKAMSAKYRVLLVFFIVAGTACIGIGRSVEGLEWSSPISESALTPPAREMANAWHRHERRMDWWSVVADFGSFLVASAAVHWAYFWFVRHEELAEQRKARHAFEEVFVV